MKLLIVTFLFAISLSSAAVTQGNATREIAARTELHAFQSLTLSDQQFLTGDRNGKAVTLTGELRIAQGTGRLPLVVLMHGSGGIGSNMDAWVRQFGDLYVRNRRLCGPRSYQRQRRSISAGSA